MLTILVKTIVDTNNNTLAKSIAGISQYFFLKSIANTNTNPFVTLLFTVFTLSNAHFFQWSSINKVNKMIVVEKMAKSP